jgi:glycosyltransferase involved in cell wall biosynthesis
MSLPSVTAVVATHDRPDDLRRAVSSILGQDYGGDIRCVVVVDGGAWPSLEHSSSASRKLTVVPNLRTPGLAGARNTGLDLADGDLVALCDDDDEWLPHKVSRQVEAMSAGTAVSATGVLVSYRGDRCVRVPPAPVTHADLLRSRAAALHPSTIVARRDAMDAIGWFDEQIPGSYGEDYEWLLRATARSPIAVCGEPLVAVRRGASAFADRWQTIADAIDYLVDVHPEVVADRRNAARLYGRLAFAHAALGRRREALRWAWRSARRRPSEPRPYLALAVASGAVKAGTISERAMRAGRGV